MYNFKTFFTQTLLMCSRYLCVCYHLKKKTELVEFNKHIVVKVYKTISIWFFVLIILTICFLSMYIIYLQIFMYKIPAYNNILYELHYKLEIDWSSYFMMCLLNKEKLFYYKLIFSYVFR